MNSNQLSSVAALHPHEAQRIVALRKTNLLDSVPSERFDSITRLAAEIFDVPIALVSLVDANRQWFLSNCGLSAAETNRDDAFCAHAIHEDEILVVEDASSNTIFSNNPLVTGEPHIRFYAGAVIRDEQGLPLGTLCIIDSKPRSFSIQQQKQLIAFANLVKQEMLQPTNIVNERLQNQFETNKDPITNAYWQDAFFNLAQEHYEGIENTSQVMLMVVDVHNLDYLNNAYGRMVGDQVIWEISNRITQHTDNIGHRIIGRLNANRLAIFISLKHRVQTERIDETMLCLSEKHLQPVETLATLIDPQMSAVYAVFTGAEMLFKDSMHLLQLVLDKMDGNKPGIDIQKLTQASQQSITRHFDLSRDLVSAIEDDSMHLVYQPKVATQDKHVTGMECLLRWQHPIHGFVSPLEIFEIAINTNCVFKLEMWIFDTVLSQLNTWLQKYSVVPEVSINLTGETLINDRFHERLQERLSAHAIAPAKINIEIVETSFFRDLDAGLAAINRLCASGISFSLDDFGTGYSNLSYLKIMPLRYLKIDKSFVDDICNHDKAAALCHSLIAMAHSLGLQVVAEGVENKEQFELLDTMKCDQIQGYYCHRPMAVADMEKLLATSF